MSVPSRGIDVDRELANDGQLFVGSGRNEKIKAAVRRDFRPYVRLTIHTGRRRCAEPTAALADKQT